MRRKGRAISVDDVEVVRRLYAAFNDGDMATAAACFIPDARRTVPGRSLISGTYVGWDEIRDRFLTRVGPLSGGTLRAELREVAVGERFVVAVQHATGKLEGRILDLTACQLMEISGGRISRVRGHYSDQEALDAFWGAP